MIRFLVPVDGSEPSERAIRFVMELGRAAPISVRLLHVEAPPPSDDGRLAVSADARQASIDAGKAALRSAGALLDGAGIEYTSELRPGHGYVPGVIAQYALEAGCTAIVMGTRGMGTTGELLGSIARQVVNHSDVPVTLVK